MSSAEIDIARIAATAKEQRAKPCPEPSANFLSKLFFSWMDDLMKTGYKQPLEMEDIWDLRESDKAHKLAQQFDETYSLGRLHKKGPSVLRTMHKCYGFRFYCAGILKIIHDSLQLVSPVFLKWIIEYMSNTARPVYQGYIWVGCLLLSQFLCILLINQYFDIVMSTGLRLRSGLITAIYRKALRLSSKAKQNLTTGEIVNLMSVDTQKITELTTYLHMVWSGLFQIVVCLVFLFDLIGVSAIAGLVIMVILIPFQGTMARLLARIRTQTLKFTDSRIKLINEILQGIRVIKFYAWEKSFIGKLFNIRNNEIAKIKMFTVVRAINSSIMMTAPVIVSVATYVMYVLLGNQLSADKIFTSLAYFNLLRFPLTFFPTVVGLMAEAKVSLNRIGRYLDADETLEIVKSSDYYVPVKVKKAAFDWSGEPEQTGHTAVYTKLEEDNANATSKDTSETKDEPRQTGVLTDIDFEVQRGELVCVVGAVGSGKSSLLSGILGEMPKVSGSIEISGSIAYCPQQAWIQNATLKDNITFGLPLDQAKYENVLRACALLTDIQILPNGDQTEIGEKGINLSGGQKQRVNVARATYSDADIYLLDDPLSAVDAHVGRYIFEECINGALRSKTRILVTHQWQYLPYADKILFMKDGTIAEQGSYQELMNAGGEFADLMNKFMAESTKEDEAEARAPSADGATLKEEEEKKKEAGAGKNKEEAAKKGALMQAEERAKGTVTAAVYKAYFKAAGGIPVISIVAVLFLLAQIALTGNSWWLAMWSSDKFTMAQHYYLIVYCLLAVVSAILNFCRDLTFSFSGLRAATSLHNSAFERVMRAPMSFFDTTPVGRVLARFSKDQESIDSVIISVLQMFINCLVNVISTLIIISYVTPPFLIPLVPIMYVYFKVQQYYRRTSRELKRLDSLARSPLYAHFSETLGGLTTIRAYNECQRFRTENESKLDVNNRAYFAQISSQRWLAIRLELVGLAVVLFAAVFAVASRTFNFFKIDAAMVGLSLTYALQITGLLNWTVRQATEVETQMNAVERAVHYSDNLESEAPAIIPDNRPPPSWPTHGNIRFENVVMKYRKDLDPVLKGVSFTIKSKEKVGIVGRTGAGKSSLMIGLFRLVELEDGSIIIDGEDISKIGLEDLRSRLSIIPQDPVLFSGTIRDNLDPFNQYSDKDLWDCLARAHLKHEIERLPDKLNAPVAENGENFSVGQRQLICLARAMLRRSRILVMDEATASVDIETDSIIQKTVREEFAECTMLTIAHRLNTIIDSDRILVLSKGEIAEFDTPRALLENENSIFSSMVAETGPANARNLKRIAFGETSFLEALTNNNNNNNASASTSNHEEELMD